jgi:hypothetical protein
MTKKILHLALAFAAAVTLMKTWAGGDRPTEFTNQGSITNTRHNLSAASLAPIWSGMGLARNQYFEVCVYCHTPHAANANVAAPLWNRNIASTTYTTYNQLNTSSLTQTVYQPGAASLTCLSCHDGQQAVDAIMNMPGSGGYSATPDTAFLDSWIPPGDDPTNWGGHMTLGDKRVDVTVWADGKPFTYQTYDNSCLSCHAPGTHTFATDFRAAAIGTDLRNDHPVGVTFPATTGTGTDWNTPASRIVNGQTVKFFDDTANGRMDKNEIRLYDSGNGPSVECASCHDPHGVPSAGAGSKFFPTFMRKSNVGSALCLTCHSK